MNENHHHVRIIEEEVLSDNWAILKKTTLDYQSQDGDWQTVTRETYNRGNGATILLYNPSRKTVILTRQFRYPAYVNQHDGYLIETCAGLLDDVSPMEAICREVEEETGFQISNPQKVFEAFMSPGSVTERLFFFVAEYEEKHRKHAGGGILEEGENIEVIEVKFSDAMTMIANGEIVDGKTIMLLQYALIHQLL